MLIVGEWTALIIAAEAILVALALAFVLFVLLRRSRQQIAHLLERIEQLSASQASVFLDREIANTREAAKRAAPDDRRLQLLTRLRLHWLQIEQKALQREGGNRSDIAFITRSARAFLALVREQSKIAASSERPLNSAAPRNSSASDKLLRQARATITLQKGLIIQLKGQLTAARATATNARDAFSHATLDKVSENTDAQLASVTKLEAELLAARASYDRVNDELARLQLHGGGRQKSADDGLLIIDRSDKHPPPVDVMAARNLLDDMDDAHNESLSELQRMRETNSRQRALILELEGELTRMRKGSDEAVASLALLDNLKRQLRDYENCTAILEMETDNLRARIAMLNDIVEQTERSGKLDIVEDLQREIEDGAALRQRSHLFVAALKRLAEMATANSMEEAIALLRSGFGGAMGNFTLLVKGANRQYWFSSDGEAIDNNIRHFLLSIVPVPGTPWTDVKGGAVYAGTALKLFLESGPLKADEFERACLQLTPQLQVIDGLLRLLDIRVEKSEEAQQLRDLLALTAKQLNAIDVQHHYLSEENARLGANLQSELQQYFSSLTLTDIQRECIESMLGDFRAEVTLLAKASKAVHHNLRAAARALDSDSRE